MEVKMKIKSCVCTDQGSRKKKNQDALILKTARFKKRRITLAAVCDGMGGLSCGEVASAACIRMLDEWFYEELPVLLKEEPGNTEQVIAQTKVRWKQMAAEINLRLGGYGRLHEIRLGTTLLAVLVIGNRYLVLHVGDSRIYLHQNERGRQLTQDHTYLQHCIAERIMTPQQAASDTRAGVLMQCIGASEQVSPDLFTGSLEPRAALLLCTDGFWRCRTQDEIEAILKKSFWKTEPGMERMLHSMVRGARKRGETDDISAVLLRMQGREKAC